MQPNQLAAFKTLEQAQSAMKSGDKATARQLARQAAQLAPELEEVWLMMAAVATKPEASLEYIHKAQQINPNSPRVQKGLAWATGNLRKGQKTQSASISRPEPITDEQTPAILPPKAQRKPTQTRSKKTQNRTTLVYAALLGLLLVCLIGGVIFAATTTPVSALFRQMLPGVPAATQAQVVAAFSSAIPTELPSSTPAPTATLMPTQVDTVTPTLAATATPTESPSPTLVPSETATEAASPTPLPTDTPEPTAAPVPTQPVARSSVSSSAPSRTSGGVHWIEVNLTQQMVYAYEGDTLVNSFVVSTGAAPRLTVTGSYHVYERHVKGNMWGPGYFLPDVPYIMYFHKGYALHGTYWHSNFGTPMSHGCVNLSIPDAEWLYYWSSMGTLVKVHY
jgi:lipoprotein-anchoring transpeptidase ErfK/SrfK